MNHERAYPRWGALKLSIYINFKKIDAQYLYGLNKLGCLTYKTHRNVNPRSMWTPRKVKNTWMFSSRTNHYNASMGRQPTARSRYRPLLDYRSAPWTNSTPIVLNQRSGFDINPLIDPLNKIDFNSIKSNLGSWYQPMIDHHSTS